MNNTDRSSNLRIVLKGSLMDDGAIESKVLLQILNGTAGAIESMAQAANFNSSLGFYLRPPEEGSFSIDLQTVESAMAMGMHLWPQVSGIKDIVSTFVEYLKIKIALRGEALKRENIQTNDNGGVVVKNIKGNVIYNDNRNITNINLIVAANDSPALNKKVGQLATALERSTAADSLCYRADAGNDLLVSKKDTEYLKFEEKISHRSDSVTGYIRKIDNKTNHGSIVVLEDGKEKSINFELDIRDISRLETVVNNLAIAEGNRSRVQLIGDKELDPKGRVKRIRVHDVELPDGSFDF